ncbi:MAG: NAD(+) synthase [Tenericutes bacterium HGW-Tenericutes-4]|nr:MAG: NAD(+) synthase [Tenericutes bacterium HGW-Tenericutes-4]
MLKQFGFVRVGAVVPQMKVADTIFNAEETVKQLTQLEKEGVQIVTFPEISLTGYTCADLFHQDVLLEAALNSLKLVLQKTKSFNIISILGMPLKLDNQLFNVAVVIQKGSILGVIPKTYIPNYSEFYEKRWFSSGLSATSTEVVLCGQIVPFGTDLLFYDKSDKNICFAVEICEDFWTVSPPSNDYALNGATIIFNLSASNEIIGKFDYRKNLVKTQSGKCMCAYIYSSCGIGESSSDLVFSGHSLIAENGSLLKEGKRFTFDSEHIIEDIDTKRLISMRNENTSFMGAPNKKVMRKMEVEILDSNTNLLREYEKNPFVPNNELLRNERCEEILNIQASGLAKRLKHIKTGKTVIGISGGLDSTLAFLVIDKANKMLNLTNDNIIAITMPGFGTSARTYNNSLKLIKAFGATLRDIDIKPACIQHLKDIGHNGEYNVTYENVQARERTQILMDIANQVGGIVIGTGDLSEQMLGWSTYNGDHMSMYSVNNSIPKTLVKYLVQWAADLLQNEDEKQVIYDILNTPISPELLPTDKDGKIEQKTESVIGPYELHDFFTYHFLRYGASPSKIVMLTQKAFKNAYTKEEIIKWLTLFLKRFFNNQFKRNCVPDGPKVGTISLSPRGDLRMPSDAEVNIWLNDLKSL